MTVYSQSTSVKSEETFVQSDRTCASRKPLRVNLHKQLVMQIEI